MSARNLLTNLGLIITFACSPNSAQYYIWDPLSYQLDTGTRQIYVLDRGHVVQGFGILHKIEFDRCNL